MQQMQAQKCSINAKQPLVITSTSMSAFEKIYLDTVGPLRKNV